MADAAGDGLNGSRSDRELLLQLTTEVRALAGKVDGVAGKVDRVAGKLDRVEARVDRNAEELAALRTGQREQTRELRKLQDGQHQQAEQLAALRADHGGKLDRLLEIARGQAKARIETQQRLRQLERAQEN